MNNKLSTLFLLCSLILFANSNKSSILSQQESDIVEESGNEQENVEEENDKPTTLINSGYLFYGYNIAYGNPHSTTGSIDPGFTNPIFETNYKEENLTGDLRYRIPVGSVFGKNLGCDISMTSREIKGETSYKASFEVEVGIEADTGFKNITFEANAGFKYVSENPNKNANIFIESKADCRVFNGHLEYYDPPKFTEPFIKALMFLNDNFMTIINKSIGNLLIILGYGSKIWSTNNNV